MYFLREKSSVFEKFQTWLALVERESGKVLKCLRSDNGGEYTSNAFNQFCKSNGIKRQFTVPNTPQQNGIAERMNSTLMERAKALRLQAVLPLAFWTDALRYAVYVTNRVPCSAIKGKIPEERWSGRPISLKHLKCFGSTAYMLINEKNRNEQVAREI